MVRRSLEFKEFSSEFMGFEKPKQKGDTIPEWSRPIIFKATQKRPKEKQTDHSVRDISQAITDTLRGSRIESKAFAIAIVDKDDRTTTFTSKNLESFKDLILPQDLCGRLKEYASRKAPCKRRLGHHDGHTNRKITLTDNFAAEELLQNRAGSSASTPVTVRSDNTPQSTVSSPFSQASLDTQSNPNTGSPVCESSLKRPRKRVRSALNGSLDGDGRYTIIEENPEEEDFDDSARSKWQRLSFRVDEEQSLVNFYMNCFERIQQKRLRQVVQYWIGMIEPKKSTRYRYGNRKEPGPPPAWWPSDVSHESPHHLKKPSRMKLAVSIMRQFRAAEFRTKDDTRKWLGWITELQTVLGIDLNRDGEEVEKFEQRKKVLIEMFRVARIEEEFRDGGIDGDTLISTELPSLKAKNKRLEIGTTPEVEQDNIVSKRVKKTGTKQRSKWSPTSNGDVVQTDNSNPVQAKHALRSTNSLKAIKQHAARQVRREQKKRVREGRMYNGEQATAPLPSGQAPTESQSAYSVQPRSQFELIEDSTELLIPASALSCEYDKLSLNERQSASHNSSTNFRDTPLISNGAPMVRSRTCADIPYLRRNTSTWSPQQHSMQMAPTQGVTPAAKPTASNIPYLWPQAQQFSNTDFEVCGQSPLPSSSGLPLWDAPLAVNSGLEGVGPNKSGFDPSMTDSAMFDAAGDELSGIYDPTPQRLDNPISNIQSATSSFGPFN